MKDIMTGGMLPMMTHLMDDARETLQMRDKRIAELKAMAREMVMSIPGGQFCDPQQVADMLREIAKRHGVTVE